MYRIKLTNFEGPLDLLHQLIESKKLEITEISLAQVADQFLSYLKSKNGLDLADMAAFLSVAGRLALIKSRALLPFLKLNEAEEADVQNLQEQLAEYQKCRQLVGIVRALDKNKNRFYARPYLAGLAPIFYFPGKLTAMRLKDSLENLLNTLTLPQRIPQARVTSRISLEEKLAEVEAVLAGRLEAAFSELAADRTEEKVAVFLSVLELIKRRRIWAEQKINFGDIKLKWQSGTV